ncbi:MAG TPA: thioredoxin domain-containing protein [Pseudomonadales bacterium]
MDNRLGAETSPYLRQHADNPVYWQPWDDQAIAAARSAGKPILLSIGYSACHWCHVMAHESFEDPGTAAVMNQHYVCIKVDREERPDLDKVYQLAHQLLTQQAGGWPLTAFLDPDTLLPFFAGTYFPKTPRYQLPGFKDLLLRVAETFASKREELTTQGQRMTEVLGRLNAGSGEEAAAGPALDAEAPALIGAAHELLASQYDPSEGGFGTAPKFPMPGTLSRELQHWALGLAGGGQQAADDRRATLDRVMTSLTKMARGGIYDHLGGGFFRYATDRRWMIPHFEKMLYDNAQLLCLYSDALAIAPDPLLQAAVTETAGWMLREMRDPAGGFYAAMDADSEGEEGRYYLWRRDQVKKLTDDDEYLVLETLYGLDKPANFEGKWNLHRHDAWRSVVSRLSLDRETADAVLASGRAKLLAERNTRVRPETDDKVLTAWNGLAVEGLARAGVRLARPDWIEAARQCVDFLRTSAWNGERLQATWTRGQARYTGYLDDYANLMNGLLALLSAGWRESDADFLLRLADTALTLFHDDAQGGFFFTAHDQEALIYRPKPTMDDALPPGNGAMALALTRLGHLFGESRYLDAAWETLEWAREHMRRHPSGHCTLLSALALNTAHPEQIIVRGAAEDLAPWLAAARAGYRPTRAIFGIPWDTGGRLPAYLPKLVSTELRAGVVAYRCEGLTCSAPITDLEEFRAAVS